MAVILVWPLLLAASVASTTVLGWRKSWALDLVICAVALIVGLSLALSLVGALTPVGLAIALATETTLASALAFWKRRDVTATALRNLAQSWRRYRFHFNLEIVIASLACVAMIAVIATVARDAFAMMEWRPINADSLTYHVPRAYFWLEDGRVGILPVDDFRWNELPPNGSILIAWTMASGSFPAMASINQYLGIALLCLSIWRLLRALGAGVTAAAVGVLCVFGFPSLYVQAPTASNDLLVAGLGMAGAYYLFAIARDFDQSGRAAWGHVILFGAVVGLGCGLKNTFGLLAPAALLAAGLLAWNARNAIAQRLPVFVKQSAAIAALAIALGSWTYVHNLVLFGNPISSPQAAALLATGGNQDLTLLQTLYLSLYQTATLHGFETLAPELMDSRYELFAALGEPLSFSDLAPIAQSAGNPGLRMPDYSFGAGGHGLIGALSLLAALTLSPFFARRAWIKRDARDATLALIGFACISALILFSTAKDWTPSHPRYFISFLPLGLIVLIAAIHRLGWARYLLLAPLAAYAAWMVIWMTDASPWRMEIKRYAAQGLHAIDVRYGGDLSEAMRAFRQSLPSDRDIGVYGKIDSWAYAPITLAPGFRYVLGESKGNIVHDWAIIERPGLQDVKAFPWPRWLEAPSGAAQTWIRSPDLRAFVSSNLDRYEIRRVSGGGLMFGKRALVVLAGVNDYAAHPLPAIDLVLPSFLLDAPRMRFSLPLNAGARDLVNGVACNGTAAPFTVTAGETRDILAFEFSAPEANTRTDCVIQLRDTVGVSTINTTGAALVLGAPAELAPLPSE